LELSQIAFEELVAAGYPAESSFIIKPDGADRPRGPAPYSPERDILHITSGLGNLPSLVHHELGDAQGSGGLSPTRINT
jgi:hypothetical protein